jgi:hypothetical protein
MQMQMQTQRCCECVHAADLMVEGTKRSGGEGLSWGGGDEWRVRSEGRHLQQGND